MAWAIVSSISKLMFTYSGGDEAIETINPPQMTSLNTTRLIANPYPNSGSYYQSARTDGDLALYNAIMALQVGKINLLELATMLNDGETGYLWREETGRNVRLNVKKNSYTPHGTVSIDVTASLYGTNYAGSGVNGNAIEKASLGFVYDDASEKYSLFISQVHDYDKTTYRRAENDVNCVSGGTSTAYKNYTSIVINALLAGNVPPEPPGPSYNPYADGDFSAPSGDPTGDYDDMSDVISVPSVPSFNLGITSLINVWVPSTTDINNLANYLWSNFDLTDPTKTLSKMFTDPLSYILSLHMLPFTVSSSTPITVTLAGLATTESMPPATEQFHDIDCGSVTINEYWGNYLDYTYTKIVLCLPFCGQVDLDPDEVMGQTIKVKYRVDVITGAFVCFVYIDGDKVLGQYAGNCAAQIPISAADFSRLNAAVLGVAGAAASAFGGAALGGQGGMLNGASGGLLSSIAANAQNAKVRAQHSGGLTGAPGFMGIQKPYLIIHRPRQSVPEDYEQFKGYPSNVTMQLSSCTGFTSVREIKLNGLPFTDGELTELRGILEGGVIL